MEVSAWKGFWLLRLNLDFYFILYLLPPGKHQGCNSSSPCSLLLRSNQTLHWVAQGWCNSWFSLEYHRHKLLDKKTIGSIHHTHRELQKDVTTCQPATYRILCYRYTPNQPTVWSGASRLWQLPRNLNLVHPREAKERVDVCTQPLCNIYFAQFCPKC